jgi:hypothetical protein
MIKCSSRVSGRGVSLKAKVLQSTLKGISPPAAASAPGRFPPNDWSVTARRLDGVALASHQRTNRVSGSPLPKGMLPSALCLATHCRYSAFCKSTHRWHSCPPQPSGYASAGVMRQRMHVLSVGASPVLVVKHSSISTQCPSSSRGFLFYRN